MALADGVWRLLHPSGVVGTGMRGFQSGGARGGEGGGQGGPRVSGRILRSCGSYILYGDDGFFKKNCSQQKFKYLVLVVHFCVFMYV